MALAKINLGTVPNAGLDGDDARTAFTKVNANFDELYTAMGGSGGTISPKLTTLATAVWAANQMQYQTGPDTIGSFATTAYGRAMLNLANAAGLAAYAGLGNVNNTSDANKPVSSAQQAALDAKLSLSGGKMTGAINEAVVVPLASAATVAIGAAAANTVSISGSTTITAFEGATTGTRRLVRFLGTLTLTHSSGLQLPGNADIVTAPGDFAEFVAFSSTAWLCLNYYTANGQPLRVVGVSKGGTGGTTPATARSGLGLGTAATLDQTQSTTDLVAGRAMKVGDLGLGVPFTLTAGADLNACIVPGTYVYAAGSPPANSPIASAYDLEVIGSSSYPHQVLRQIYSNNTWIRSAAKANPTTAAADWTPWQNVSGTAASGILTTSTQDSTVGRVLKVGDWGLGSNAVAVNNLDTLTSSCFFITAGSPIIGAPTSASGGQGYGVHIHHGNPLYATQEFTSLNGWNTWRRVMSNGVWLNWVRLLGSGEAGVGQYTDLRGSIYVTGTPTNVFGTGTTFGFCNGGSAAGGLSIPGLGGTVYGTLQINAQYTDFSGSGAIQRIFTTGQRQWIQLASTATTWGAWQEVITMGNLIGTVSATAGQGAVFESASNANGRYIKYADGTMSCWGSVSIPAGAVASQVDISATFAAAFLSAPNITHSPSTATGSGSQADIGVVNYNGIYVTTGVSTCNFSTYRYRLAQEYPVTLNYHAHGRWK
ncbi:hypothetical protein JIQ88_01555 [Pseudomonas sp. PCH44]|uniref:pyocin knob domain-containing protein n=1 Tax=Pseudomonas sp. PCH44 TaxID=2800904 RepID=UPI001BB0BDC8|nr:pyocin knob domain-containing protein [Pseudomonas sp. PCH44]MBS3183766.1 hypothetical protein [Pseudomonas sp. PCH44]